MGTQNGKKKEMKMKEQVSQIDGEQEHHFS